MTQVILKGVEVSPMCRMLVFVVLILVSVATSQESKSPAPTLQGKWEIVEMNMAGDQVDPKIIFGGVTWLFQKNNLTITLGKREVNHIVTVDTKKTPGWLDLHPQHPSNLGKVCMGIYKFEGETLVLCSNSRATGSRPKDFSLPDLASGNTLYRMKRMK